MEVQFGILKTLIILGEIQERGWKDFVMCLHRIFKRKPGEPEGTIYAKDGEDCGIELSQTEKSWRDIMRVKKIEMEKVT